MPAIKFAVESARGSRRCGASLASAAWSDVFAAHRSSGMGPESAPAGIVPVMSSICATAAATTIITAAPSRKLLSITSLRFALLMPALGSVSSAERDCECEFSAAGNRLEPHSLAAVSESHEGVGEELGAEVADCHAGKRVGRPVSYDRHVFLACCSSRTRRRILRASANAPCLTSQRGLSGIASTPAHKATAGSVAIASIHRQIPAWCPPGVAPLRSSPRSG